MLIASQVVRRYQKRSPATWRNDFDGFFDSFSGMLNLSGQREVVGVLRRIERNDFDGLFDKFSGMPSLSGQRDVVRKTQKDWRAVKN